MQIYYNPYADRYYFFGRYFLARLRNMVLTLTITNKDFSGEGWQQANVDPILIKNLAFIDNLCTIGELEQHLKNLEEYHDFLINKGELFDEIRYVQNITSCNSNLRLLVANQLLVD